MRKGAREECHARKALEHARGRTQAEGHRSAEGREEDSVSDTAFTDEDAHRPPDIHHRTPCRPGLLGHHGARGVSQLQRAPFLANLGIQKRATAPRQSASRLPSWQAGSPTVTAATHPSRPVATMGKTGDVHGDHTVTVQIQGIPRLRSASAGHPTGGRVGNPQTPTPFFPTRNYRPWRMPGQGEVRPMDRRLSWKLHDYQAAALYESRPGWRGRIGRCVRTVR